MLLLDKISALVKEPPPAYGFEVSEAGIASAHGGQTAFKPLPPGVINVTPLRDNVQKAEDLSAAVWSLHPQNGSSRRRAAALVLPDYCARVQVLDFDSFPQKLEDQLALIRFRVRKTTPFDIDSAAISFFAQSAPGGKVDVVAAIIAFEILARYEAPFRAAGYHTGAVTTSCLASLPLFPETGVNLVAKLSGRTLTVMVLDGAHLKLIRCLELARPESQEILAVLHPTVAYVEDELKKTADRVVMCGFGENAAAWGPLWEAELGIPVEPARSRLGTPAPHNAGLLGLLESGEVAR